MFQFLDKQAMGYTAILDLRKDLHLTGQSYSWAGSIFYFGYLAASWPIAHLLVRFPVGKTLATSVCAWAVVLMLMAACTNAGGLLAARFFLGMCEAAVAPGFSVVTSMWYKRSEQPLRHGAWFMGNVVSGLFGSILAYSMANVKSETLAAWQAVFIIFGAFSLAWSVTLFWTIPDSPTRAWFLKGRDDAKIAVARVKENLTGIKSREWKWDQCVEALKDPQAWLFVLIQLCGNIPNGGVTTVSFLRWNTRRERPSKLTYRAVRLRHRCRPRLQRQADAADRHGRHGLPGRLRAAGGRRRHAAPQYAHLLARLELCHLAHRRRHGARDRSGQAHLGQVLRLLPAHLLLGQLPAHAEPDGGECGWVHEEEYGQCYGE